MSNKNILFRKNVSESCEYFCRLVEKDCKVSDELQRLLATFRKVAWAIEAMENRPTCVDIKDKLVSECIVISSFLLDKMTNELTSGDEKLIE